jgi:hypothetical protein
MQLLLEISRHLAPLQPLLTVASVLVGAANLAVGILKMRRARQQDTQPPPTAT